MGHVASTAKVIGTFGIPGKSCECAIADETVPNFGSYTAHFPDIDATVSHEDEVVNYIDCHIANYSRQLNKLSVGNDRKKKIYERKIYIFSLIKCLFFPAVTATNHTTTGCIACPSSSYSDTYPGYGTSSMRQVQMINYIKEMTRECNELNY
jgi:hypothetical protein